MAITIWILKEKRGFSGTASTINSRCGYAEYARGRTQKIPVPLIWWYVMPLAVKPFVKLKRERTTVTTSTVPTRGGVDHSMTVGEDPTDPTAIQWRGTLSYQHLPIADLCMWSWQSIKVPNGKTILKGCVLRITSSLLTLKQKLCQASRSQTFQVNIQLKRPKTAGKNDGSQCNCLQALYPIKWLQTTLKNPTYRIKHHRNHRATPFLTNHTSPGMTKPTSKHKRRSYSEKRRKLRMRGQSRWASSACTKQAKARRGLIKGRKGRLERGDWNIGSLVISMV